MNSDSLNNVLMNRMNAIPSKGELNDHSPLEKVGESQTRGDRGVNWAGRDGMCVAHTSTELSLAK